MKLQERALIPLAGIKTVQIYFKKYFYKKCEILSCKRIRFHVVIVLTLHVFTTAVKAEFKNIVQNASQGWLPHGRAQESREKGYVALP